MLLEAAIEEPVNVGYIYLYETDERYAIQITESHRETVHKIIDKIRSMSVDSIPPLTDNPKKCEACSAREYCMPEETAILEPRKPRVRAGRARYESHRRDVRRVSGLRHQARSQVGTEGGRITVWDVDGDEGELASFPTEKLDTINVFGGVNFSTPFVAEANRHGIILNYFTQNGKYRGSFVPEKNTIAEVRRAQYDLDETAEIDIAADMIAAKIRNARTLLSRKGVHGTELLKDLGVRATTVATKDGLRGVEGEAAERYFNRLDETLTDGWTFEADQATARGPH